MSLTELFVAFVMLVIIVMYVQNHYGEIDLVTASLDKRRYVVQKFADKDKAAELLAGINKRLIKLVHHMVSKHPDNADVQRLYTNYNPDAVSEGSANSGYTSYSVNKGEKIILCVRQKNGSFVDINVIMYVAIHEIAHLMTKSIGHTPAFWENFRWLLEEAIAEGLYKKVDFHKSPEDYCGIRITSSVI
jgi:predicted metal-dependent hydrolase